VAVITGAKLPLQIAGGGALPEGTRGGALKEAHGRRHCDDDLTFLNKAPYQFSHTHNNKNAHFKTPFTKPPQAS
jgi:hypothetical protein